MALKFLAEDEGNPHLRSRFPHLLKRVVDGERDFGTVAGKPSKFPNLSGRDLTLTFRRESQRGGPLVQGFTRPIGVEWQLAVARGNDVDFVATPHGLSAWRDELASRDATANASAIAAIDSVLPEFS